MFQEYRNAALLKNKTEQTKQSKTQETRQGVSPLGAAKRFCQALRYARRSRHCPDPLPRCGDELLWSLLLQLPPPSIPLPAHLCTSYTQSSGAESDPLGSGAPPQGTKLTHVGSTLRLNHLPMAPAPTAIQISFQNMNLGDPLNL